MKILPRSIAGFSLIELLASAAIIGLLATVAVPFVETAVKRQKEHDLRLALNQIRQAIDAYKQATLDGRIAVTPDQSGYPLSLALLVGGVANARPGYGPPVLYFLRRIPRDPFFPDASVATIDTWALRSFDSPPDSPRSGSDVFDVHSQSAQTGLNGVPYKEW